MPRVHTTVDRELLARLDARANARGITRARLLREAIVFADGMGAAAGADLGALRQLIDEQSRVLAEQAAFLADLSGRLQQIEDALNIKR